MRTLIQSGVFGAMFVLVLVPLAYFAYKINYKYHEAQREHLKEIQEMNSSFSDEIQEIHNKRHQDSQAVIDRIMALSANWNNTINEQLRAATFQQEWLRDVRETLKELGRGKNGR